MSQIDAIDWETSMHAILKNPTATRTDRKYQAEFLVYKEVPVHLIESFVPTMKMQPKSK
ncbi:MAG: DUF4433 domain-containing protein [Saprospiraceae bacterium]|nr:DUF4433 domain-containing protein [Saprospiraceae bacterium]